MESGLFLDVIVREGPSIFELLAGKDQSLLIWRNSFLVLDLGFDILNCVRGFNFKRDCLASEGLDKDLHATPKSKHKMESGLLLDVVVRESPSIFELLASKDQPLLIWRNSFLVLDLGFDILNGVRRFNFKSDCLASEGLDKDLHATPKSKHKMESGLLLDVVVREGPSIFKLLAGKDQPLLVRWDSFFVLDLGFDILNGVRGFNFKSDCLASEGLDKDLHATPKSEYKMESGLFLDVIVREGPSIFELLAGKDQS